MDKKDLVGVEISWSTQDNNSTSDVTIGMGWVLLGFIINFYAGVTLGIVSVLQIGKGYYQSHQRYKLLKSEQDGKLALKKAEENRKLLETKME